MSILFVCSQNKWRSLTAEAILKNNPNYSVKSAGTENGARVRITEKLVSWADIIFVMEKRHKERLNDRVGILLDDKELVILDIADDYKYMDSELIEILKISVSPNLNQ
jgi:predicted protein tyrosine phosphatase